MARLQWLPRHHEGAKEFTDATGRRRIKGNMDIELAIEMLELAPHLDQIYLFSATATSGRWWRRCSARA